MFYKTSAKLILVVLALLATACPENAVKKEEEKPKAPLSEIPAQLLNYRFEADVPAPSDEKKQNADQINEAVRLDFDNNRPQEMLDKALISPDSKRVLAVYHKIGDLQTEFRLDMYSAEGKLLSKITHEEMAVHFPDTIVWAPDSQNVAFVAMVRGRTDPLSGIEDPKKEGENKNSNTNTKAEVVETADGNTNTNTETNTESNTNTEATNSDTGDSLEPPKDVITFRTEQIYICNADGGDVKPLTQNEGLIYFYFTWAPNSSALAALATPITEWRIRKQRMGNAGYLFVPMGRPRLVEKNGRERLLDDFGTYVHPVWSPDSAKVAVAYNKQVRIYDAVAARPTQAAIPLRNDLLLASRKYDEKLKTEESSNTNTENSNTETPKENNANSQNANANLPVNQPESALPNPNTLVSFNPIINLDWLQADLLYLQTGFVRDMQIEAESVRSYLRWHRLILSSQVKTINKTNQN